MRAVTETLSPASVEHEQSHATRVTQRRALDTCAVDREAIAEVGEPATGSSAALVATLAAHPCFQPVRAQLEHLEQLLVEWMTGNPASDQAALAELECRNRCPIAPVATVVRESVDSKAAQASGDYVEQLAAKLLRRSA